MIYAKVRKRNITSILEETINISTVRYFALKRESINSLHTQRWPVLNSVDTFYSRTEENVMNQYIKRTQRDYSLSFSIL